MILWQRVWTRIWGESEETLLIVEVPATIEHGFLLIKGQGGGVP